MQNKKSSMRFDAFCNVHVTEKARAGSRSEGKKFWYNMKFDYDDRQWTQREKQPVNKNR